MLVFQAHATPVLAIAFSPDGLRLASAGGDAIRLWSTGPGQGLLLDLPNPVFPSAVAFSPDGQQLACVGHGTRAWLLAQADTPLLDDPGYAQTCAFSPDGRTFVAQGSDRPLRRYDTTSWSRLPGGWGGSRESNRGEKFPTDCVAYHPEGALLASSYAVQGQRAFDSVIYLRDPSSGEELGALRCGFAVAHPTAIAFSPDGEQLAGVFGPYLRSWNVPTRAEAAARKVGSKHFKGLAFTPDSHRLVTVSNDETVRLWDTACWSEVGGFQWKVGKLISVAVAPDGMRMAAGSSTGKVVIWDVD